MMLRQSIRSSSVRTPWRAFNQQGTQPVASDGPWRRFFSSPSQVQTPSQLLWRRRSGPISQWTEEALRNYGAGRVRANNATGPRSIAFQGGASRRGFRTSTRRTQQQQQQQQQQKQGARAGEDVKEPQSLRDRLKKLSKEYGWVAVGVYLSLSVLDFPFCFLIVKVVGAETIGRLEHHVVTAVKRLIPESLQQRWHEYWRSVKEAETKAHGDKEISNKVEMVGWGVEEAQERNKEEASLGTQLALAYAIHKSFIFLRVPLTAAVTPKVVKVLRSWGWNIGKRGSR